MEAIASLHRVFRFGVVQRVAAFGFLFGDPLAGAVLVVGDIWD